MRGVTFLGERKLQVADFPDPAPGPHDVVVEIKASGMCGSDLKFYRASGGETAALGLGKLEGPVIAGHEPCGVVAAVGSQVEEGAAIIDHDAEVFVLFSGQHRIVQQIGHAEDGIHRRANFVGHLREEVGLGPRGHLGRIACSDQFAFAHAGAGAVLLPAAP